MILDAIILALGGQLSGLASIFTAILNLFLSLIEAIIQLFLPKLNIPRVGQKRKGGLNQKGKMREKTQQRKIMLS